MKRKIEWGDVMKKIDPKIFWEIMLIMAIVTVVWLWILFSILVSFVFLGVVTIGLVICYPFLPYIPAVQNFALYMYELQLAVLRILRMAEFDTAIKYGWMTKSEIVLALDNVMSDERNKFFINVVLDSLEKDGAILRGGDVPVVYLKNPPTKYGFTEAYKIGDDSNYRPKKPRCLSKKRKDKQSINDGVSV